MHVYHPEGTQLSSKLGASNADYYPDDRYDLMWTNPYDYSAIKAITSESCSGPDGRLPAVELSDTMASPQDPLSKVYSHINGPTDDLLDRLAVAELCKGWPLYRDASEWKNFRSLFAPTATVWTTWSGPLSIDDFIEVSKAGKTAGAFIMHRECGTLVELGPRPASSSSSSSLRRAIGKMKATITQRFVDSATGIAFDVDCDCRFFFFCQKAVDGPSSGWQAVYLKLIYEKDKLVPVDGAALPPLTADERRFMAANLPDGYRYLGIMQRRLGYSIDPTLPTLREPLRWQALYAAMEAWLAGQDVDLHNEPAGSEDGKAGTRTAVRSLL